MDRWLRSAQQAPVEERPLPPSLQQITIDDDAIWEDLCDSEQWKPLHAAVRRLATTVRSPQSIRASSLSSGQWNFVHFAVVFEVERLHYLLLARQLSERIQNVGWEEPLSSLLHGLDVAVATAMETGRMLAVEMNAEDVETSDEDVETSEYGTENPLAVEDIPAWGRGYAYVLYRRYLADLQCVLDLLAAICEEAYQDEGNGGY